MRKTAIAALLIITLLMILASIHFRHRNGLGPEIGAFWPRRSLNHDACGKMKGPGEVVGTSTGQARRKAAILDMLDFEEDIRGIPDILELI